MALTQTINADASAGANRGWRIVVRKSGTDTQAERDQCGKVAVLSGDFGDLFGADQCAEHVGVSLDRQGFGLHAYGLFDATYGHRGIGAKCLRYVDRKSLRNEGLETFCGDLQVIRAYVETIEGKVSG